MAMLRSSTEQSLQDQDTAHTVVKERRRSMLIIALVVIETILVLLALVPAQFWTRFLPNSTSAALHGPFPPVIAPIIPFLLYFFPTVIGCLCSLWQQGLFYATLPAWFGSGVCLFAARF